MNRKDDLESLNVLVVPSFEKLIFQSASLTHLSGEKELEIWSDNSRVISRIFYNLKVEISVIWKRAREECCFDLF